MSDDIAIVGLAGRFGPAADAAAFYESLLDGRCLLHRDDGGPPRSAGASAGAEPGQPVRPGRAPQAERPGFVRSRARWRTRCPSTRAPTA